MEYIESVKPEGCIFCDKPRESEDQKSYILYRGKRNFVILNSYPYNPGHVMVAPYRHVANLEEMSDEELLEHSQMVAMCIRVLKEVLHPHGFNVGMNMGKVGGAGVEDHIHTHVVPRWEGDTNFMPVTADTKVIPQALDSTYRKLQPLFSARKASLSRACPERSRRDDSK
jgi:ATP adenylyltransferase